MGEPTDVGGGAVLTLASLPDGDGYGPGDTGGT